MIIAKPFSPNTNCNPKMTCGLGRAGTIPATDHNPSNPAQSSAYWDFEKKKADIQVGNLPGWRGSCRIILAIAFGKSLSADTVAVISRGKPSRHFHLIPRYLRAVKMMACIVLAIGPSPKRAAKAAAAASVAAASPVGSRASISPRSGEP